jgi:hypothetical protein
MGFLSNRTTVLDRGGSNRLQQFGDTPTLPWRGRVAAEGGGVG